MDRRQREDLHHSRGSRQTVTVQPVGPGRGAGSTMLDVLNEVGHAVDMASCGGGVYSTHPDLAFTGSRDSIGPSGRIAAEEAQARQNNPGVFKDLLAYPCDQAEVGGIITTSDRASQELFTQLWAISTPCQPCVVL